MFKLLKFLCINTVKDLKIRTAKLWTKWHMQTIQTHLKAP